MSTILIVDDDAKQRADIATTAEQTGFPREKIVRAATENEALLAIERQTFNVAVVDIMLAEPMGGEEGLRVISKLALHQPDCRIIALTTKIGGNKVGVRALEAGAHDFISSKWEHVNWMALLKQRIELWRGIVEGELPTEALEV